MDIEKIKEMNTKRIGKKIEYYKEIESTHKYAKDSIEKLEDGTIILAEKQTEGRGTKGRAWYTGENQNIALTIVLKTNCSIEEINTLTVDVAKIVQEAIYNLYGYTLEIKEPNDLMLNGKKISGILIESSTMQNKVKHIILSMGFNVNETNFDKDTEEIATSLKREYKKDFSREEILIQILERLDKYIKF